MTNENLDKPIIWWKDTKLLIGVILIILNFILGFYAKALIVVKFYEPISVITGLSIYAFSFILLLMGVFLVGWETVKLIQQRIHHHVKRTVKMTYHGAKELPRKGIHYTRQLHKKFKERNKPKKPEFLG